MSADPLQHVAKGEPLNISARTWNTILDAVQDWRRNRVGEIGARDVADTATPSLDVMIQNDTGGTLSVHSVLAVGDPLISAIDYPFAFSNRPVFGGDSPVSVSDIVAITQEPLSSGQLGKARLIGVAVCIVNVTDAGHGYATPTVGDASKLTSGATGSIQILWKDSGTGDKTAVVLLQSIGLASGGTFTAQEQDGSPSSTTGIQFPNGSLSISGSDVLLQYATALVAGLVSNSDQYLGSGTKTVDGLATGDGNFEDLTDPLITGVSSVMQIDNRGGTGCDVIVNDGKLSANHVEVRDDVGTPGDTEDLTLLSGTLTVSGDAEDVNFQLKTTASANGASIYNSSLVTRGAPSNDASMVRTDGEFWAYKYSVRGANQAGRLQGASGTGGGGDTVTGGIITTLGSGPSNVTDGDKGDITVSGGVWTIDVASQTLADVSEADSLFGYDDSAAANRRFTVDRLLGYAIGFPGGRLTLTSGTPVTTADVTGAGTLYYTPFHNDRIWLYDGTRWVIRTFTERSLSLSVTSGKNYDVFLYDNSGTLTLELSAAWTNDTTRADAITTQNGVRVKSGSTTRLWLGTLRASGTNTCEDSRSKRFLDNGYHQKRKCLRAVDTTDSWNYSTATWRQANASTANKVEFVDGWGWKSIGSTVMCLASNGNAVNYGVGVGLDSTSINSATIYSGSLAPLFGDRGHAYYDDVPGLGYHYLAWLEQGGSSGTTTWYGDASLSIIQTGMVAWGEF